MTDYEYHLAELVTANRILANEGIVDGFGHISCRHPTDPQRFMLSRARAPACIEAEDILEFDLNGHCLSPQKGIPYLERFIHAAIYEARPEVRSVVHSHSHSVIPFGVTSVDLLPITNQGAVIGSNVPKWDCRTAFGDTDMLVSNMEMGRDLVRALGVNNCCLMRGHGCVTVAGSIRSAVYLAIVLVLNAKLQSSSMALGEVQFLSPGEVEKVNAMMNGLDDKPQGGRDRAWEDWCRRCDRPYLSGRTVRPDNPSNEGEQR